MKKTFTIVSIIIIAGVIFWYTTGSTSNSLKTSNKDNKNTTYIIEGQTVALVGGRSEVAVVPGSASKTITQYFGNDATGDLNGDGLPDIASLVTQTGGGSGTFYYVVVAFNTKNGYQGTNAILIGDRIAPQSTEIKDGKVIVNYADRVFGEPITARPSVGMSKYFKVQNGTLIEVGPVVSAGERCGGNMTTAPVCGSGLHCAQVLGSKLPFGDIGGVCVAD